MRLNSVTRAPVMYLTLCNAIFILVASGWGIFSQALYSHRQNTVTLYELRGYDIVTCLVGTVLLIAMYLARQGNIKAKVVWLGCLTYMMYMYGYFCFGLMSSMFYLLYILIVSLSFLGFVFLLGDLQTRQSILSVNARYPRRSISILLLVCAGLMSVIEVKDIVSKTIVQPGGISSFDMYYVLDLSLVFPAMMVSAIMNWRKQIWGHFFAGVLLIKVITLLPALVIGDVFYKLHTGHFRDLGFDSFSMTITLIAILLFVLYVRGVNDSCADHASPTSGSPTRSS